MGRGSSEVHALVGVKDTDFLKPIFSAQAFPAGSFLIHFFAEESVTLSVNRSSLNSEQASEARKPVQVSTSISCHKSCSLGRGGWLAANSSVVCSGHHFDGSVPDMAHIVLSTIPAGRLKGVRLPWVSCGTANCINLDQMGAAPVEPFTSLMDE